MSTTTTPRQYVIGLPVIVTVHQDGRVEYEVDTAEASSSLNEDITEDRYSEEEVEADRRAIEQDHNRRFMG